MKYIPALLLLLAALASSAPPPGHEPGGSQLFPCINARYSTPMKLSFAAGVTFMQLHSNGTYSGFFSQIEPGIAGGRLNFGYRYGEYHFLPVYHIGACASLMHTWGNPLGDVESGQTYIGIELSGAFNVIILSGGAFRHIAGDDEENDWIYSLGAGLGI